MNFTFGSDPEFCLTKNGQYFSAISIVKADTDHRIKQKGHEFYYDNVLAECAIKPGATLSEVLNNFRECFKLYANIVKPYKLMPQASQIYPENQLKHPKAREAGCVDEWLVYTLKVIPPPKDAMAKTNFRTAGAHIHLGGEGILKNSWERPFIIFMLDLFLGIPSILMDHDPTSKDRRKMYGVAGSHRTKVYGVEYRPLSPFWLTSPRRVQLIWEICSWVLDFCDKGNYKKFWEINEALLDSNDPSAAYKCYGYDVKALRKAINTCDKTNKFMDLICVYMPESLINAIMAESQTDKQDDFYTEWQL